MAIPQARMRLSSSAMCCGGDHGAISPRVRWSLVRVPAQHRAAAAGGCVVANPAPLVVWQPGSAVCTPKLPTPFECGRRPVRGRCRLQFREYTEKIALGSAQVGRLACYRVIDASFVTPKRIQRPMAHSRRFAVFPGCWWPSWPCLTQCSEGY